VELASLFDRPTIAGVAAFIDLLLLMSHEFDAGVLSCPREEFDL
jgi:hypothetical protein